MSKYRFKTREEFIRDELWDEEENCPYYWNSNGEMNEYLGKDVPDECIVYCDEDKNFKYDGWLFQDTDYILKEQQEYFNDLSQHIGRYIRALIDNPHSGSLVYKGDVGKIINKRQADFPNSKGYYCTEALRKDYLGIRYELLPEDYSPEQEFKEPSIEFIPGKWYKLIDCENAYRKCSKIPVEDRLPYSELIGYGSYRCETGSSEDLTRIKLVEDLSEIQEYLPDGHPDKIINQKFEIGKWYKWYQKNHGSYHYGKVKEIDIKTDTIVMSPWIMQCTDYTYSGSFDLSKAEQIQEISVEEVQEFLPKDHSDKISSDIFKKGEYIVITDSCSGRFCTNYIYKQREDYKHLRSELDNKSSKTNGLGAINKSNLNTWRYATQEEIYEYERRGKPYDVIELQKKQLSMEEIQEECKKRFPIGCTYISTDGTKLVLKDGYDTYRIFGNSIWAHMGGECLFQNGKWAELVSLPEENITEIPEYIEAIDSFSDYFIQGKIYKVKNSNDLTSVVLNCNNLVNFNEYNSLYVSLTKYRWKPSTKEAYEQQKPLTYESVSGCFPTDKKMFIYDEVGQYPLTPSECWEKIPKFVEQDFDIYGPTPDIE